MIVIRRALLVSRRWGTRLMVMADSMVSIGAGMKGHSGSAALLRLLRPLAAQLLATGSLLYLRRVPGHRNHADGPSRGQKIGQAEKANTQRFRYEPQLPKGVFIDGVRVPWPAGDRAG